MEKLGIVYFEINVLDLCCHSEHQTFAVFCMLVTDQIECMVRQVVHLLTNSTGGEHYGGR